MNDGRETGLGRSDGTGDFVPDEATITDLFDAAIMAYVNHPDLDGDDGDDDIGALLAFARPERAGAEGRTLTGPGSAACLAHFLDLRLAKLRGRRLSSCERVALAERFDREALFDHLRRQPFFDLCGELWTARMEGDEETSAMSTLGPPRALGTIVVHRGSLLRFVDEAVEGRLAPDGDRWEEAVDMLAEIVRAGPEHLHEMLESFVDAYVYGRFGRRSFEAECEGIAALSAEDLRALYAHIDDRGPSDVQYLGTAAGSRALGRVLDAIVAEASSRGEAEEEAP
jgi:hypothetical protein